MNRRDFLKTAGIATGGFLAMTVVGTSVASSTEQRRPISRCSPRYHIHGNKRLGCSGFDFPDDPDILETGAFMPQL
jgi:hypothetical protein